LAEPGVVRVQENVPVGVVLTQLVATDPDERPIIRYWIDHAGIKSYQLENYETLFQTAFV
jgi:hypothetical protein